MFFGPVYPVLVLAAMKLDPRFAEAVRCSVEANRGRRNEATCEAYEVPMRVFNALLLTIGVLAVASATELIFQESSTFLLTGMLALAALVFETFIFSFVMTESAIFSPLRISICVSTVAESIGNSPSGVVVPFIVFTSNVFAILGLRALYFLLAELLDYFRYLGIGLALVLIFVGAKMVAEPWRHISVELSLGVVAAILFAAILISLLTGPKKMETNP